MAIAAVSTVVEWYDFTLFLYFVTVLARVFHGGEEGAVAAILAGFAAAYLMRPLGALVFGHVGDRFGRRTAMLTSVALMSAAMLAVACLPTHAAVGPAAAWMLLALRCVTSFAVGGEYVGVVAYLVEGARADRRGLVASFASAASEIGALLAVGLAALTTHWLDRAALDAWGWRIPFLFGAGLALAVLLARAAMEESPDFERQARDGTTPERPLAHALAHHRAGIFRGFAISALGSITYYVGITYVPAFLATASGFGESEALLLSTGAAVAVILVTPLAGLLSDLVGRRPVLVVFALGSALLPAAMFWMMSGGSQAEAALGAIVLAGLAGGVSAVGAVATAEQFPGEGRLTGLALGATTATAIFGGLAPYVAQLLLEWTGSPLAPGAMIAAVAIAVLPVLALLPPPPNG